MELRDIVAIVLAILSFLGLGGWAGWKLRPKVLRDTDAAALEKIQAEKLKLVEEIEKTVIERLRVTLETVSLSLIAVRNENKILSDQNKDQQRQLDELKSQVAENDRTMRARIAEVRSVLMRHIRSWKAAVMHADVSVELQQQIMGRVEPLPDGYDREDGD